jgi:mevalonate kinase
MLELLSEGKPPPQKTARRLRDQISEAVRPWFPAQGPAVEQLEKLLGNHDLALNVICDLLGFAVPLAMEAKQELLEELDIEQRGEKLVQFLQTGEPPKQEPQPPHKFPPPEFSKN